MAWVGDRPRWPGWLPEAAGAIPRGRRLPEQYSEDRAQWLLLRHRGEERSEAGRARKRARQEDSQGPEALAARRPIVRALDVLREREERQELATRTASKGGATQSQQGASQDEGDAAPVIKGVKRKGTAATKREQRKKQATEALAWDLPERPAST